MIQFFCYVYMKTKNRELYTCSLGVFFKKRGFDVENKNRPFFARIYMYVYISHSYPVTIAGLVFQLKPHLHKNSLKTAHTNP